MPHTHADAPLNASPGVPMTAPGTYTTLPSLRMIEAADHAYQNVLAEAAARGAGQIGAHIAMSAALSAAQMANPVITIDDANTLATRIATSSNPQVDLIDALRAVGVEVLPHLETTHA